MKSDISGFPEFMPNEQIAFNKVVDTIRERFELYGFVPMDTPAVERIDALLAKGNDNEIYGIYRLADENSKKDLGLRFDLTVPLARYVAANSGQLVFPHKRYQISPVWRGERPQRGRYRQFYQCDVDIIGAGDLSIEHDAEIVALIIETLRALEIPSFQTKINNRKLLYGFLRTVVEDEEKIIDAIRLIDKSDKISRDEFEESMKRFVYSKDKFTRLKIFLDAEKRGDNLEILRWLKALNVNNEYAFGVSELSAVVQVLRKLGIEDNFVKISTKLARGLTYYTGSVFETTLDDSSSEIGSISGGGRYDNLTETLGGRVFPGVGATIGVSRLVPWLIEKGLLKTDRSTPATVLVTVQNREFLASYMKIADKLRKIGVKTETCLQDKSLGAQLNYADKKGYDFAIIANEVELLEEKAIVRNLKTKEQQVVSVKYVGKKSLEWFR
jgi:histidyl-tRNA synthetase